MSEHKIDEDTDVYGHHKPNFHTHPNGRITRLCIQGIWTLHKIILGNYVQLLKSKINRKRQTQPTSSSFQPYRKPSNNIACIHEQNNHPYKIIKNVSYNIKVELTYYHQTKNVLKQVQRLL